MSKKEINMIDLFAGAGGLTLGFTKAGFTIKDTIEFDKRALETYNYNFQKECTPIDITDKEQLKDFLIRNSNGKTDLLICGFPCQGYSLAGKRGINDKRNQLYKYAIKVIKKLDPEVFVLENVKGILSFNGNNEIRKIIEDIRRIKFECKYVLLNSENFQVPQRRERVIFIGSKKENLQKIEASIKVLKKFKRTPISVKEAIEDLINLDEDKSFNHIMTKHSNETVQRINNLKEGANLYKNFSDSWKRIKWDIPSPTVKENHGAVHIHPKLNRVMTPREIARLQSFPDNFIFKSTKSSQLKQIGNAVPVNLSYNIAKIIKKEFFDN